VERCVYGVGRGLETGGLSLQCNQGQVKNTGKHQKGRGGEGKGGIESSGAVRKMISMRVKCIMWVEGVGGVGKG
jgi:hypothetical protein